MGKPNEGRRRIVIENLQPELNCGCFAIKRIAGESVTIEADVFADGHDEVEARLLWKRDGHTRWQTSRMQPLGNDRWRGDFLVTEVGRYLYTVAGTVDHFSTWLHDFKKRVEANQDLSLPLESGAILLEAAAARAAPMDAADAAVLKRRAQELRTPSVGAESLLSLALDEEIAKVVQRYPDREFESHYVRELAVVVDRERAGFSAWYELFPRSWGRTPGKHGTLRDVASRMEYVAGMGFDILYLPPIHPIGKSFRKGKNNSITASPGDVGSPWAIGSAEGGHKAILHELGTMEDLENLVQRARQFGMEIALDIAFQCAPDHPWVTEHPEFFKKRPDGSIQYAENPPKKYQDIYPLDFETANWEALWEELKGVFLFWMDKGIQIFRVDNPHTKAFPFWEWVIGELKAEDPNVILLAEAFTRPRLMERLAKLGFSQSYTYFAWRNTKEELTAYMIELTQSQVREYLRPNFWPNTPDILTEALQTGGRAAFKSRLVLAATLAANYGIYGPAFELGESVPFKPGSEEYLNSEKYEIKSWNLEAPYSLRPLIQTLNRSRKENRALQSNFGLCFHSIGNPMLLCYSKRTPDGKNTVLVVVNLDPFHVQWGWVDLDLGALGLKADESFEVDDLLTGHRYQWRGARNYVELRPQEIPAHLFRVRRRAGTGTGFDDYR
jgi:starch synthase (maltosyl-transferring)